MLDQTTEVQVLKAGDKVHYTSISGSTENGILKSIAEYRNLAFVVYHCNNDWDNYENYTGCGTNLSDLKKGWVEL